MADISNLSNFLTDVGNSIRAKKGTTDKIPAANFDTEIASIETGIDTSDATATAEDIVRNKTAYVNGEKVTGTVSEMPAGSTYGNMAGKNIREETLFVNPYRGKLGITIDPWQYSQDTLVRKNGNPVQAYEVAYEEIIKANNVTPDKIVKGETVLGLDGTAEVGSKINNQDKTITSNGTYTADTGYTGLGQVIVNVPQEGGGDIPVKLFDTIDTMQADITAKEDDLAIVYRKEIENSTVDSVFRTLNFPMTVTLPGAITESYSIMMRAKDESQWGDGNAELSSTSFRFNFYGENNTFEVTYTSTDGITYTRTDTVGNPIDLGLELICSLTEGWNDNFGYFIQIETDIFEGLFKYNLNVDLDNQLTFNPESVMITDNIYIRQAGPMIDYNILLVANKYLSNFYEEESQFNTYIDLQNKVHIIYAKSGYNSLNRMFIVGTDALSFYLGTTNTSVSYYDAVYDETTNTFINETAIELITKFTDVVKDSAQRVVLINGYPSTSIGINDNGDWRHFNDKIYYLLSETDSAAQYTVTDGELKLNETTNKYLYAPTQLTLSDSNRLQSDLIAYGKNGVIVGNGNTIDLPPSIRSITPIYGLKQISQYSTQITYNSSINFILSYIDTYFISFRGYSDNADITIGKINEDGTINTYPKYSDVVLGAAWILDIIDDCIYYIAGKGNSYLYDTNVYKLDTTTNTTDIYMTIDLVGATARDISFLERCTLIVKSNTIKFDLLNKTFTKLPIGASSFEVLTTKYARDPYYYYTLYNMTTAKHKTICESPSKIIFVNRYGNKIMIDDSLYQLNDDLSKGELLVEHIDKSMFESKLPWKMTHFAEDYYQCSMQSGTYSDGYLVKFHEDTNTFEMIISLKSLTYPTDDSLTPYFVSSSNFVNYLTYEPDKGIIIGYEINDDKLYKESYESVNSTKVLSGYQTYSRDGIPQIGTMADNGELMIIPSAENKTIAEGYISGGTVQGDANLIPENIKKGITIFGVEGTVEAGGSSNGNILEFDYASPLYYFKDMMDTDTGSVINGIYISDPTGQFTSFYIDDIDMRFYIGKLFFFMDNSWRDEDMINGGNSMDGKVFLEFIEAASTDKTFYINFGNQTGSSPLNIFYSIEAIMPAGEKVLSIYISGGNGMAKCMCASVNTVLSINTITITTTPPPSE